MEIVSEDVMAGALEEEAQIQACWVFSWGPLLGALLSHLVLLSPGGDILGHGTGMGPKSARGMVVGSRAVEGEGKQPFLGVPNKSESGLSSKMRKTLEKMLKSCPVWGSFLNERANHYTGVSFFLSLFPLQNLKERGPSKGCLHSCRATS